MISFTVILYIIYNWSFFCTLFPWNNTVSDLHKSILTRGKTLTDGNLIHSDIKGLKNSHVGANLFRIIYYTKYSEYFHSDTINNISSDAC